MSDVSNRAASLGCASGLTQALSISEMQSCLLDCSDEIDELEGEIERLRNRLPKTADGVPIVADMEVWLIGSNCDPFQVTVENEIVIRFPDQETSRHYAPWCYSTKEAAEKARAT